MAWGSKGRDDNGNDPDVEETESWSCGVCGAGGTAAKGQASTALAVHMALAHPS